MNTTKQTVKESTFLKIMEQKKLIQQYIKEGKDLRELASKGVKFVRPI